MILPDLLKLCTNMNSKEDPLQFFKNLIQTMEDAKNLKNKILYDPDSDLKEMTNLENHKQLFKESNITFL